MVKLPALFARMAAAYRNSSLRRKLLIAYFVVIVLPFSLFVVALINASVQRAYEAQLYSGQHAMQQDTASLSRRMAQIQSYSFMFQNDKRLIEYLSVQNRTVADEILSFQTELYPLFAYVLSLDSDISHLEIHSINKPLVPLPTHILYGEQHRETTAALPMHGQWQASMQDGQPLILHQVPLYSSDYSRRLGYLEIHLRGSFLEEYLMQPSPGSHQYVRIENTWYGIGAQGIAPAQASSDTRALAAYQKALDAYVNQQQTQREGVPEPQPAKASLMAGPYLANRHMLPELEIEYISLTPKADVANFRSFGGLLLVMLVLFLLLSAVYYLFLSTFTRRLTRFSQHIRDTRYGHLEEFAEEQSEDEIGQVIESHNQMIARMRELVSDLNISQLKQDQARYYALQAQIRPHFLYNALETARMMAESNDDEAVSDFIYNLGIFIRYSFTSYDGDISLRRELDTTQKYLEIYKATMGNRLDYSLDVEGDVAELRCPPFLIQPLVENAIRHGMASQGSGIFIQVSVQQTTQNTTIIVRDSGVGMSEETLQALLAPDDEPGNFPTAGSEKGSIGVRNVLTRVHNYYGPGAGFQLSSSPGAGTVCTITIPNTM